jgi:putative YphP/YqiW family bacilliredoxin
MGVIELRTVGEADAVLKDHTGTTLVVVNSVCGCAAGSARPAVRLAMQHSDPPDTVGTVFAGVYVEATSRAREYMAGIAPSSPCMALFKNGELVLMIERFMIEGSYPDQIADALKDAFDSYCAIGTNE